MGFDLAHTISSISKLVLRAMRVSNKNELSPMKAVNGKNVMTKYTFEEIKTLLLKSINEEHIEAELRLVFKDKPDEYMMVCVHSKDAEILKGKLLPTIKHWTSCMWLNKLIISFWRGIGTIL